MSPTAGNVEIMATTPPVPRQRDAGKTKGELAKSASQSPADVTSGGRPPEPPASDQEPQPGEILSADLLRQVRARRRQAKARRAAVLRSLALLRSSGYRDS